MTVVVGNAIQILIVFIRLMIKDLQFRTPSILMVHFCISFDYLIDCVFGPEATTETVYQGVGKRIVDSFVKGINGIFTFSNM